jgi:hypothetical protein
MNNNKDVGACHSDQYLEQIKGGVPTVSPTETTLLRGVDHKAGDIHSAECAGE